MPDRNTIDDPHKYDHSEHSTKDRQTGDLGIPGHGKPGQGEVKTDELPGKVPEGRPRSSPKNESK